MENVDEMELFIQNYKTEGTFVIMSNATERQNREITGAVAVFMTLPKEKSLRT
jgi:hypothetical protein